MSDDEIKQTVSRNITEAFRVLLSDKHLYQSIYVDVGFLDAEAKQRHEDALIHAASPGTSYHAPGPVESFREDLQQLIQGRWFPSRVRPLVDTGTDILYQNDHRQQKYDLPTIKATCPYCEERGPFNPVGALVETGKKSTDQWISLSYECQNCKGEPVRFLVRRTKTKLTLSGRDPFETIEIPNFIPKQHAENFRNALIASHAGQMLAAIFLMRVFVEQFWKSVPEIASAVKGKLRPTGDELGEAYRATLPASFKERFPTLTEVYDSLSEAMHAARADGDVFSKCHSQIIDHFDARRLFKLVSSNVKPDQENRETAPLNTKSRRASGKREKSLAKRVRKVTPKA